VSDDLDPTWRHFGESRLRYEPPDLVFIVAAGEVTPALASALYDEVERLAAGKDHILSIVKVHRLTLSSPQTRKITAERSQNIPFRGTAIVGASGPLRALASLLLRATRLLNPRGKDDPVRFFDTEGEARTWIAERRRAIERPEVR
jgi:hypothetical protein